MSVTNDALIQVVNLHKSFNDLEVLKGVSEEIHKGEVVSIIGPSGSGKSTFLRCLNLLETPDKAKLFLKVWTLQIKISILTSIVKNGYDLSAL